MWVFWIFIIVVLVWVIKASTGDLFSGSSRRDTPLEILEKRYARGEINEEEFNHRRRELEKD